MGAQQGRDELGVEQTGDGRRRRRRRRRRWRKHFFIPRKKKIQKQVHSCSLIVSLLQKLYSVPTQFCDGGTIDGDGVALKAFGV